MGAERRFSAFERIADDRIQPHLLDQAGKQTSQIRIVLYNQNSQRHAIIVKPAQRNGGKVAGRVNTQSLPFTGV